MDPGDYLIVSAVVVLFVVSVLMALGETAFTKIGRVRGLALEEEGRRGARRLVRLLEHPERTLNIILFVTVVSHFTAASMVTVVVYDHYGGGGVVAAVAVQVVIFFVGAEVAPKTYAILRPDAVATRMAGVLWLLTRLTPLRLLTRALIGVANLILPGKGLKQGPFTSEEEIRNLADVAAQEEIIEREERRLIHSIFEFGDTVVREVMVPRPDMVMVEADATVDDGLQRAIEAGFSRIPVYRENADDIAGLVYLKDMVRVVRERGAATGISSLIRPAVYVPEQKRVAELLREMQTDKFHMAIVVDEYGGTAGLVTLEDLLEEIVGEIVDEYDVEEPRVERLGDGCLLVAGRTSIDEVNELLDSDLPATEWDTVGGLMFNLLGHVPIEGERVACQGIEFRAEQIQGRRILTVHLERTETETERESVET